VRLRTICLRVSLEYLSRTAPEILGVPLHEFLRKQQLTYSVRLLSTTPLPINEIALRCAFGTYGTFRRWFVATYGISPKAFREVKK